MVDFTKNKSWAATQVIEDNADAGNIGKGHLSANAGDANNFNTGFLWADGVNLPGFASAGVVRTVLGIEGFSSQTFSRSGKYAFRDESSSVFSPWFEFFHEGNAASIPLSTDFAPTDDNAHSMGDASGRWSEVFAGNGAINTSDAREKTEISPFTSNEIEASKQLANEIGTYQFLASVEAKGDSARTHIGLTVQRAITIMSLNNLDPMSYGFICFNSWGEKVEAILDSEGEAVLDADEQPTYKVIKEAGDRYGFRYDQLNQFIIAGFNARLEAAGI